MNFLDKWLHIIRNCSFDNTYKMAWARAITEIAIEQEGLIKMDGSIFIEIHLRDIAKKVLQKQIEELADLLEVLYSLVQSKGTKIGELEQIRNRKQDERGGFKKQLELLTVTES